ncbi:MAG: ImmA/IrrE family metallo-endopeptidase, partial [Firmicutes bacterium]|nr:ImmA/IrrE family metallo-endopeptidase [Bacillota bacterium]
MRKFDAITQRAAELVRKYETRDPFQLAKELGIHVEFVDYFNKLKGMYMVVRRNRFIYLNSKLSERTLRIVCTHEIGHDQWHRELAETGAFKEFMLYNMSTRQEYEANIFAAEVL